MMGVVRENCNVSCAISNFILEPCFEEFVLMNGLMFSTH